MGTTSHQEKKPHKQINGRVTDEEIEAQRSHLGGRVRVIHLYLVPQERDPEVGSLRSED